MSALKNGEMPVRVQAGLALPGLVSLVDRGRVGSLVPAMMQDLLNLTNEIDSDALTETMDHFVATYPAELLPFSQTLLEQLATSFLRLLPSANEEVDNTGDDEDFDKIMAAIGLVKTMDTLLLSIPDDASGKITLEAMEHVVVHIAREVLAREIYGARI
jgi:hypothetical protein